MTSDPNSWIQGSVETLSNTLGSKNQDYAPDGEFSNFELAAEFSEVTPLQVMMTQIAIKYTRLASLMQHDTAANESFEDSLLDLAGYAIIAHAYLSANTHVIKPEPVEGKVYTFPRFAPAE